MTGVMATGTAVVYGVPVATIATWIGIACLLYFGRIIVKGQGGKAIEILERGNTVLAKELERVTHERDELLRTHTLEPILRVIEQHELEAADRHTRMSQIQTEILASLTRNTTVLGMVADQLARLGVKDGENHAT